jgi:hypothetical protein
VLEGALDRQRLIVRGTEASGVTRDLTESAVFESSAPGIVALEGNTLRPVGDGEAVVKITVAGRTLEVAVRVTNAAVTPAPSFRLDVVPALSRSGCNNGSCHGSARGQDGFHLSLFGYDPAGDYHALTSDLPGRRINLAAPAESLLVRKAIGAVPHTGGRRFTREDERCVALLRWLEAGAPDDRADVPVVREIEFGPRDMVLEPGEGQRLVVRAKYSDGTDRDVTALTTFLTSNEYAARVGEDCRVTAANPGEAHVLARFDAFTAGVAVIVVPGAGGSLAAFEAANFIDERVNEKLRRMRIEPSQVCGDEEFLRRATLDLTGLLPTVEEHDAFVADASAGKRAVLVDALMKRKEFAEIWAMKWAERLGIRSTLDVSPKATLLYSIWLQERIGSGVPIDKVVRELVAAEGGTFDSPATNFFQLETDTLKLSENVAQAFLGARIQCAQCHNHPFDRWTMNDYYGFAAFFSQIGRKPSEDPRETVVFNSGSGEMKHPVGGRVVAPRFLGGPDAPADGRDRRAQLAEWLTSRDNRMFARNVANFTWAHFFHRGIVEPVDDARVSNPPSNDALLTALADRLVESGYDFRPLVRDICTSLAYQRSTRTSASNERDESNFSHAVVRRIRAEFLLDSISRVTGTKDKFQGLPLGAHAVQIADGTTSSYFLSTFGRAKRATVCTCEVVMEPSLSQALHLINGETVHEKIRQGEVVKRELEAGRRPEEVLERLYVMCLSRRPTEEEKGVILGAVAADAAGPRAALEDVFWALLNSREFIFNH